MSSATKSRRRRNNNNNNNTNNNDNEDDGDETSPELIALTRARNALRADATRVSDTLHELVSSDERFLKHQEKAVESYDEKLNAANKRVEAIAKRERLDNMILNWSFAVFFLVVAFIVSNRLFGVSPI